LEIIKTKNWINNKYLNKLLKEADELTAIFTTTLITMNKRRNK